MTNSSLRKKRRCPYCGQEADTFFRNESRIIGCDVCVTEIDADTEPLDDEEYDDGEGETYYGNHTGEF